MAVMSQSRSFGIANRIWRGVAFLVISSLFLSVAIPRAAAQKQKLEKSYKEWLERDVAYIISKEERNAFLKLTMNDARDQFIQNFWELRNPTPGSPENTYKDEIYQHIGHANARFAGGSSMDGWRMDRRLYASLSIKCGEPAENHRFGSSGGQESEKSRLCHFSG